MKGSAAKGVAERERELRRGGGPATLSQMRLLARIAARTGKTFSQDLTITEASQLIKSHRQKSAGRRGKAKVPRDHQGLETRRESQWPMEAAERMQLKVLCDELDVPFDPACTRKQARRLIDQLRSRREKRFRAEREARRRERRRRRT